VGPACAHLNALSLRQFGGIVFSTIPRTLQVIDDGVGMQVCLETAASPIFVDARPGTVVVTMSGSSVPAPCAHGREAVFA
jgi:hypothetical protein